jgi:hypothetical protein
MKNIALILWVFALVCFGLRALGVNIERPHLGWLGATFAALAVILG